jgi:hypothetical protein
MLVTAYLTYLIKGVHKDILKIQCTGDEILRKLKMICQVFHALLLLHFQEVKTVPPCALKMSFFYSHPLHI